ncbi:MAG: M20/M25/M40 family metallo-hydrolase [Deltaproteobacteria bacterium]|nr:M20/M25/M40 family metallo-hydrolase [Deltaproteobacteria bacterium]
MRLWLLLAAACHASSPHSQDLASRAAPAVKQLDPAQLERDTKYLASDELEGREPGTPGGRKAEDYIAKRYAEIGLQPAGDHGTYFQDVPMREATLVTASLTVNGVALEPGRDVAIRGYPRDGNIDIDQPLVFVGYGIHRPDLGYDDLEGVQLHGAIAVIFTGAPRTLNGKPVDDALHAVLADTAPRYRALRDRGATAVLGIYDPVRAERMPFAKIIKKMPTTGLAWMVDGAPASDPVLPSAAIDAATFDRLAGAQVAHALWEQLDRGEHPRFDQPLKASLRITSTLRDITARNVVAMLPGGDLHDEIVAYSAHHDHLGIGAPVNGDHIYNGALDNAIGVAAMLEIARGLKALSHPPRRSVLFIAVTGEEKGLLGSEYFVEHPTLPIERIVANINIDGVHPSYQVFDVEALGAEHSSLQREALAAARAAGLNLSPDRDPAQVHFIRSDQYSFVKRGIPAVHTAAGVMDEHGGLATNRALQDAWESERYHQPSDEWQPGYHAEWTLPEMKFELMMGLAVADADTRPTWNARDVFGDVAKPAARGDSRQPVSPPVDASAKPR